MQQSITERGTLAWKFKEKGPSLIVHVLKKGNLEFWGGGIVLGIVSLFTRSSYSVLFVRVQSQPLSVFLRVAAESQHVTKRRHLSLR